MLVHGWKDNLASFDRLIPHLLPALEDKYYFLAIDLPGHGFSSHFPPGMTYQVPDCFLLFARIFRHYKWKKPVNYIGHSFGAILGFIYSATNPGFIDRYVRYINKVLVQLFFVQLVSILGGIGCFNSDSNRF